MSIYTSAFSVPANPLQRKPGKPSTMPKGSPATKNGDTKNRDSVKFGQKRQNGIWVTTERLPAQAGGLGAVSKTIPDAISKYTDKDMRVIIPYEKANQDWEELNPSQAFQPTNLTIQIKAGTKTHKFEVLQKFEPATRAQHDEGNWVYALKSPLFMEDPKKAKTATQKPQGLSAYTYTGANQDSARKTMLFNMAAAELINRLNNPDTSSPNAVEGESGNPLQGFEQNGGKVDFVIGNDWLSGPVLYQQPLQRPENQNIRKVFMLHNTYDNEQGAGFLDHYGLPIPKHLKKIDENASPLHLSLQAADAVIANRNFVKTITNTPFSKGQKFVDTLKAHSEQARVFDMHHGLADDYTPANNVGLRETQVEGAKDHATKLAKAKKDKAPQEVIDRITADAPHGEYRFEQLQENTPEGWQQFKQVNKAALQTKLGLKVDPKATVIGWAARFDPFQKGFFTVQNAMEKLMDEHPNLQVVIAGIPAKEDPGLERWAEYMKHKFPDRIYIPYLFKSTPEITQINAGSDFIMLPSLYEPYGLTQLEAMKMGAIPLVHGVDGIRSSVSDPDVNGTDFIGHGDADKDETAWEYGQTGILMKPHGDNEKPIDVPYYRFALGYEEAMRNLEFYVSESKKTYRPVTQEARKLFDQQATAMVTRLTEIEKEHERRVKSKTSKKPEKPIFTKDDMQKITALKEKLSKPGSSISLKDKKEVFDAIIRNKLVDPALKPAECSFSEAVERALDMDEETRAQVCGNAVQYVNEQHTWEKIVGRYEAALDADSDYTGTTIDFYKKSPFAKKPSGNGNKPDAKKTGQSQDQGFMQQALDWFIYIISFGWLKSLFGK